jgi:hypothetical protein
MNYFIYLFHFAFIGIWVIVTFMISKMGWRALATNYRFVGTFTGQKIGLISASINGANYKNSLILKYNEQGVYLKPIFLFRLFHTPILIPWKEIKTVQDKKKLFVNFKELTIGKPFIALIALNETVFEKIKNNCDRS